MTVPRTLLTLAALATIARGAVLDGLCLLAVVAVWVVAWPAPAGGE